MVKWGKHLEMLHAKGKNKFWGAKNLAENVKWTYEKYICSESKENSGNGMCYVKIFNFQTMKITSKNIKLTYVENAITQIRLARHQI